jgi:phosphoenolpyruvate---glycerone phosphotransferase subunit DhaK
MKKLVNKVGDIVEDMITGYVAAYGDIVDRLPGSSVIVRRTRKHSGKVGLVIGNGSGHEPIAMGWVGRGMLDANALGPVFTAPPPALILQALRAADRGAGVILLISHHAGDLMNGEMAVDLARAEGMRVEALVMYDDIASAPRGREAERRGAPGTMFIYKIVGARAEEGAQLDELMALGQRVRDATRTLAVALAAGVSPVTGERIFELPDDEIFIGMGVHGEAGMGRGKIGPAADIVAVMADAILADLPFNAGDEVLAFVNGSGGTTLMELLIAYGALAGILERRGIRTVRPLVGEYVTTQESQGMSISLCRCDAEMRRLWLAPAVVPFFADRGRE